MSKYVFHNIKIAGVAGAAPSQVIDNRVYYDKLGQKAVDDFIKLTGIEKHHKSPRKQTASDLGYVAANELLAKFDIDRKEIGAIIDVTQTGDYITPSTAFVLHKRLHLENSCIAFDVNLGCAGYVYGIYIAASLLQTMEAKYILLVAGDAAKISGEEERKHPDPSNFMMPGDCATATLVERTEDESELAVHLYADGSQFQMLHKLGGSRCLDATNEILVAENGVEYSLLEPYMDGMGVFSFSTTKVPDAMNAFLKEMGKTVDDYDYYFLHQANKMIVERIAKKMKIELAKVPLSLVEYGNTNSGSVPLTIAYELGQNNDPVELDALLCGFGVGLSWGIVTTKISPVNVLPIFITDDFYEEGENLCLEVRG